MTDELKSMEETISGLISENARLSAELNRANKAIDYLSGKHDDLIREREKQRVLNEIKEHALLCEYNLSYPEFSLDELMKKIKSLREEGEFHDPRT